MKRLFFSDYLDLVQVDYCQSELTPNALESLDITTDLILWKFCATVFIQQLNREVHRTSNLVSILLICFCFLFFIFEYIHFYEAIIHESESLSNL